MALTEQKQRNIAKKIHSYGFTDLHLFAEVIIA